MELQVDFPNPNLIPLEIGLDVSEVLGIVKYEPLLAACLRGVARGNFPSFIHKTDEERIQNLKKEHAEWSAKAMGWEVTEKLDGSSMTVYHKDGESGVCSRNLDLKETEGNTFWSVARQNELIEKLELLGQNIAIQGELIGTGIQGNPYKLTGHDFYLFNVFNIDEQRYLAPWERVALCKDLGIKHVPIISALRYCASSIESILEDAEGKSALNAATEREGLVYKSEDNGDISFKAISNKFLLKDKGNL